MGFSVTPDGQLWVFGGLDSSHAQNIDAGACESPCILFFFELLVYACVRGQMSVSLCNHHVATNIGISNFLFWPPKMIGLI